MPFTNPADIISPCDSCGASSDEWGKDYDNGCPDCGAINKAKRMTEMNNPTFKERRIIRKEPKHERRFS
jgi:predicted  nucleic acid-binding Zn-ribbon protein